MSGRTRMHGGMTVGGAVAAQGGAALLARAQMDPLCADLHALGAFPALGVPHRGDRSEMGTAGVGHRRPHVFVAGGSAPKAPARCYLIMLSSRGFANVCSGVPQTSNGWKRTPTRSHHERFQ